MTTTINPLTTLKNNFEQFFNEVKNNNTKYYYEQYMKQHGGKGNADQKAADVQARKRVADFDLTIPTRLNNLRTYLVAYFDSTSTSIGNPIVSYYDKWLLLYKTGDKSISDIETWYNATIKSAKTL